MIFRNHILKYSVFYYYKIQFFFIMNYTHLMIQLIGKPKKSSLENEFPIPVTELVGKFYQFRKNKYTICKVVVWGNLAVDFLRYYGPNDYILVEGHVSLQDSFIEDLISDGASKVMTPKYL